jgi:hypothetical protein
MHDVLEAVFCSCLQHQCPQPKGLPPYRFVITTFNNNRKDFEDAAGDADPGIGNLLPNAPCKKFV